jgi:hypothetical protein
MGTPLLLDWYIRAWSSFFAFIFGLPLLRGYILPYVAFSFVSSYIRSEATYCLMWNFSFVDVLISMLS